MTFTPITGIAVEATKEDKVMLANVITLITSLTDKMRETSLYIAECQYYEDIYNVDFDELNQIKFILDKLKYIQNIS